MVRLARVLGEWQRGTLYLINAPTLITGRAPTSVHTPLVLPDFAAGFLPPQWGSMFPKLQYLLINDNDLTAAAAGVPAALPGTWTRRTAPRVFPALQALVLFNGNGQICGQPKASNARLQGGELNKQQRFSLGSHPY